MKFILALEYSRDHSDYRLPRCFNFEIKLQSVDGLKLEDASVAHTFLGHLIFTDDVRTTSGEKLPFFFCKSRLLNILPTQHEGRYKTISFATVGRDVMRMTLNDTIDYIMRNCIVFILTFIHRCIGCNISDFRNIKKGSCLRYLETSNGIL